MAVLLNFHDDGIAGEMLETSLLDIKAVWPGEHVHKLEQSFSARVLNPLFLRSLVGERDLRAGNGRAGGVQYGAIDATVSALSVKGKRSRDDQNRREKQRPQL